MFHHVLLHEGESLLGCDDGKDESTSYHIVFNVTGNIAHSIQSSLREDKIHFVAQLNILLSRAQNRDNNDTLSLLHD